MALLGQGVAAIWHDIAPEGEQDYHHWHCHEHIPERVSIPGFLRGRRYSPVSGHPKYFHFYETQSLETLTSAAYLARLNHPTPWTQRVLPYFQGTNRTLSKVECSHGLGAGAVILTLRLTVDDIERFRRWLDDAVFPDLVTGPGVVAAHLLRGDETASRTPTNEKEIRKGYDEVADTVILVEAIETEFLDSLRSNVFSDESLREHGGGVPQAGTYRLHFTLTATECDAAAA